MKYPSSELIITENSKIYHLGLKPEELYHKIILVGDPDRVEIVASFFEEITHKSQHREFVAISGKFNSKQITVLSTGIGTDNIDIVMNELDALVNINFDTREDKEVKTKLEIVRIGTSGILNPKIPILSYLISNYSIGLDNVAHFYKIDWNSSELEMIQQFISHVNLPYGVIPYATESSKSLNDRLICDKSFQGITITSSGFFGPQGRKLRISLNKSDLNEVLSTFKYKELEVNNFEMEGSALSSIGKALGHECTTICLGIGNRFTKQFATDYSKEMKDLILHVLTQI